ncbi:serine/threonine-protein kinase SMG1-like isoform X1 [Cucurbita moschata]|uniref:non-specific serine/threonine protein kinase n=1 Tax=Cucurbita moschata TaxID=3662 RepID=A0A6J1FYP6_CUCMO|nr:serine/threonine-protein kinase SMG1-like isoform X1 [Cucurbita moschata]
MMQGLHHQQQQLAALLNVALRKDDPNATTSSSISTGAASDEDDSARIAAINSIHRAIVYPPNSLLVTHSSTFLSQGFSQLLSDKSYPVRQAAAIAYGALCAVSCSIAASPNGRQNSVLLGTLVDRFIGWALPLLSHVTAGDATTKLALEGLQEFINIGEAGAVERYALPILKACQVLLEDERTPLSLLHGLLGVLTLISLKFSRCFQPHFLDIVDLLLGWALVPDLTDSDRHIIMDSFLQFQKHWVGNLQFSLGLLSKFLGDMDVLLQDGCPGTPQQFRRLLALLSCFSTILRSTASGLLELNLLEQISESLSRMLPQLLGCLSMVGRKFGWLEWIENLWKCLTLLAEILRERFSTFYPLAIDILFQNLEMTRANHVVRGHKITFLQVHGVLKTNLQLLSLQKLGLLPSSVHRILQFDAPISQLRLHPNHLVTGSSAATYIFLLQHGNNEVVEQTVTLLTEELKVFKGLLEKGLDQGNINGILKSQFYSKMDLFALIKFDLRALLTCTISCGTIGLIGQENVALTCLRRSERLISFIMKKLNPFDFPVQAYVELQAAILNTLDSLTTTELFSKCSLRKLSSESHFLDAGEEIDETFLNKDHSAIIIEQLTKYNMLFSKALHKASPLTVKITTLGWIQRFCENVVTIFKNDTTYANFFEAFGYFGVIGNLIFMVIDAASDREPKVRSNAASVLELLLQAKIVHPIYFYPIADIVLEKLGDPDNDIKNSFVRLLSHILPTALYACGQYDLGSYPASRLHLLRSDHKSSLHWKQVFALKQLPQQIHFQQLISILSYISQRWKVPVASWTQRLIHRCGRLKDIDSSQSEETGNFGTNGLWLDLKVDDEFLNGNCSVNCVAGVWWAIHEAARYCITLRLRTNLGGPTQTFAALERMLLDIAHLLQLDNEHSDGNLTMVGASGARLLPMRLLLDFVEALKKNVYNAYEGSAVLSPATRQSSLFFRANKKVCEEWFSRMCEPMMNAGLALQSQYAAIQYCTLRLQELKSLVMSHMKEKSNLQVGENIHNNKHKFTRDISRVLRHMTLALCKSHEAEALVGLQKWVEMTFSSVFLEENQSLDNFGILGPFSWITGLVYQARGQYEKAAAHFIHLLQTEESLASMGSDGIQFTIARIIEGYTAMADWKSLESWLLELQSLRSKHAGKSYSGALTTAGNEINAIHALAHFDEGDYQASWACLGLTPKSSSELTLDPKLALQRSEQMLLQALLFHNEGRMEKVSQEIQKARGMLEETLSILPLDGLEEAAAFATQLHSISAFEEGYKLTGSENKHKQLNSILSVYVQSVQSSFCRVNQDCNSWLKVLRVYRVISPTSPITLKLCINLLSLARKQKNLMLANNLNNYIHDRISDCSDERHCQFLLSSLQYERILLMQADNKFEDAFTNIWSFVHPHIISFNSIESNFDDGILKAKACLKLSHWLKQDLKALNLDNVIPKMIAEFNVTDKSSGKGEFSICNENLHYGPSIELIIEEMVGTMTKLSTRLCPTFGKSWISYASWCFSQAESSLCASCGTSLRSCLFSSILDPEVLPEKDKLTKDEIIRVEHLIYLLVQKDYEAKSVNDELREWNSETAEDLKIGSTVKAMLQQVINIIEAAAGLSNAENPGNECLTDVFTSQLKLFFQHAITDLDDSSAVPIIQDLVDVWRSLRSRRVSLFGHAAHGFIQYLLYSSIKACNGQLAGYECKSIKQKSGKYTLRATLYVLHILLNYGAELKDSLEPALSTVPLSPWQEVTPQLFARLSSHPEKIVRKQLEGLVMMLAKRSPWSVVYPTLVDVNSYEEKPSEELQHILGSLKEHYPRLIDDVQLMIKELENVTVLWEELWLSTLQDLQTDVMRRINVLKEEAARIAANVTLSQSEKNKINAAKYSAMMAPIVVALERRLASTSRKPETPHETWFHEEYEEQLKSAIFTFKNPPASAAALVDVWRPFDNIAASLASYQRKSSISLREVAPKLILLSSSDVPMPGFEKHVIYSEADRSVGSNISGTVTIGSFSEQVTILSTKTKPKKLVILGSDGETYTYLLKGREDLRLDARIMQMLQAINSFLYSSHSTYSQSLSVRYYSVTPISGRAGLIQWVNNVMSVYTVFKSWQHRIQVAQLSAVGASNLKNSVPPQLPRPSDMFYGKIIPALKEKGIRRVISRRDWPHEVKRKVLLDLMKEVPRQLLYQELWCASEGFKAFSLKLKRYAGSVAAMSMVGHILGLGDRHLDNILMDFSTGDVVHIDYNVCFDKGQKLKVPEIVPFRLTQTMEAALGLTGIEGTFRANCEAVLEVLRKNKDILLMLLEVFVWDPLVEWTRGDFHDDATIGGEERRGMELAVSLSLFASRVQEIRVPLQEHHDLLLASLPTAESSLEGFANVLNHYELASALFYQAEQERSNLVMRETSAKSVVADATSNAEKVHTLFEMQARELAQAKSIVSEKAQEASTWIDQHGRILDSLRNNMIPEVDTCLNLRAVGEAFSLISAVTVAGVPMTVVPEPTQVQCHDIDREISQHIAALSDGLSSAVTTIQVYSVSLQRFLPLNYGTTSVVHGWAQALQLSKNALSSDIISLARRQATELIIKVNANNDSIQVNHDNMCVQVEKYAKEIAKIEEECTELMTSIGTETELKAKDRLLSTFVKYMVAAGLVRKEAISSFQLGRLTHDGKKDINMQVELGEAKEKKEKLLSSINVALDILYCEVRGKLLDTFNGMSDERLANTTSPHDFNVVFSTLEEQVEKCVLLTEFHTELLNLIDNKALSIENKNKNRHRNHSHRNWTSTFNVMLSSFKGLIGKMTEAVLPDIIRSAISVNSEVMDAFGLVSQIRGSIDTALEQFLEVQLEKASLVELEKSYFINVGLITEQQLALEEAAVKGRDHLSWEEAEELASEEEACRAELHQLHQTWNQRDARSSSLAKREANLVNALASSERQFQSLISAAVDNEALTKGNTLLAKLVEPFSELESIDEVWSSTGIFFASNSNGIPKLSDVVSSGYPISEYIWRFGGLLSSHSFFIWKICVVDSFLDSCIHEIASAVDQNFGFDQLFNVMKKKLELQLQEYIFRYLKERGVPTMLAWLDKEREHLKQLEARQENFHEPHDQQKNDFESIERIRYMLQEHCNVHETARAARSAASLMRRRMNELKETLQKTSLEIIQMEWLHDMDLTPSQFNRATLQKFLSVEDSLYPVILDLSRSEILGSLRSAASRIAKSIEGLEACERGSLTAEAQLERAMGWACGGPNTGSVINTSKSSGIPPQFHDHILRRRQLLWETREKASDIIKICMSILEFEASRDGILQFPGDHAFSTDSDSRAWQQAYLNAITRFDVSYHSFARTEQEWKLAERSMEAASNELYSATNNLRIASLKVKSASGDLQSTLLSMRDCAYEASVSLSAFGNVSRNHTALTSECGSMLEEVLAITEDLHDVHNLGKEAAVIHRRLIEDIVKANSVLLPLEAMLSKDVATMIDAMAREREIKMEISPIHGQAIYQSYCLRIREACQMLKPLVPSLTLSVKGLYSMFTRLARTASLHAGNLHKALEGLGESQEIKSEGIHITRPEFNREVDTADFEKERESLSLSDSGSNKDIPDVTRLSLQDKEWLSPPDSFCSSSSGSGLTSGSFPDSSNDLTEEMDQHYNSYSNREARVCPKITSFSQTDIGKILPLEESESKSTDGSETFFRKLSTNELNGGIKIVATPADESIEVPTMASHPLTETVEKLGEESGVISSDKRLEDENQEAPPAQKAAWSRASRGRNAYAMSVLRRVEMKLNGLDNVDNRELSIAEQVDYLLKQATSVDNLCNMYEGWTPWI